MRCVGEIDITRPRWSERPSTLVPLILGNVKNFEPGAGERRFEQGRQEAWAKEQERAGAPAGPAGRASSKAEETKRMIDRVRTFIGYREYPKYGMVSRYFVYKQALLEEAERLVEAGVLREQEDVFYLTFQELAGRRAHAAAWTTGSSPSARTRSRSYQALTPPRVLTSEGEVVAGAYRRDDVPAGALVGLPVSAGTVEGRARVILDVADAELEPGDILVTAYTDPSWSPLFVAINGSGDGGGRPDDPRRGDRTGVRPAGRRGGGARHPADPGRAADPRARDGRVRRDPALGGAISGSARTPVQNVKIPVVFPAAGKWQSTSTSSRPFVWIRKSASSGCESRPVLPSLMVAFCPAKMLPPPESPTSWSVPDPVLCTITLVSKSAAPSVSTRRLMSG